MDDTISANGDIASVSADSGAAPAPATPLSTPDPGAAPISGQAAETGSTPTDATTTAPGPVPYERFEQINRRMRDAEDRWQKTEQSWGDLLQHDPGMVRNALGILQRAAADPVEHVTQLLAELQGDPRYQQKVASQAARILGSLRQQAKEDPEPQPDLVAENGAPVMSAARQREWLSWSQRRVQAEYDAKLAEATAPLKVLMERERRNEVSRKANEEAAQQYQKALTWHGFKEHEADIAKAFNENANWSLTDAYIHVLHTKILPSLPAQAQAKVVADLQSKAAAQTLNPAGTVKPSAPDFHGDFKAALEFAAGKR